MIIADKISELKKVITTELTPLIDSDYVLYDLPYHSNIGDALIWEGELAFLNTLKFKCLDMASSNTCTFPKHKKNTIILFHGGGNFGDLYPEHVDFLKRLIKTYPENKIVILPQTVFYKDRNNLIQDAKILNSHNNLTICARDRKCYSELKEILNNNICLVPDMAFFIGQKYLSSISKKLKTNTVLYMKRKDDELKENDNINIEGEFDIEDWPTFNKKLNDGIFIAKVVSNVSKLKLPLIGKYMDSIWDSYAFHNYRNDLIRIGVNFIDPYQKIYSTRLHGCILALLLNKEVILIDNSYGKNSNFYKTWLSDLDKVNLL